MPFVVIVVALFWIAEERETSCDADLLKPAAAAPGNETLKSKSRKKNEDILRLFLFF